MAFFSLFFKKNNKGLRIPSYFCDKNPWENLKNNMCFGVTQPYPEIDKDPTGIWGCPILFSNFNPKRYIFIVKII